MFLQEMQEMSLNVLLRSFDRWAGGNSSLKPVHGAAISYEIVPLFRAAKFLASRNNTFTDFYMLIITIHIKQRVIGPFITISYSLSWIVAGYLGITCTV